MQLLGFLFDYKTADEKGKDKNRYTEGEWECDGDKLPKISCFREYITATSNKTSVGA